METYLYSESGLDSICLANGFDLAQGRLRIDEIEGLHRAIGFWLVSSRKILSGSEVRFLRHELEMTQSALAQLLGVPESDLMRWELGRRRRGPECAAAGRALKRIFLNRRLAIPAKPQKKNSRH